MPDAQDEDGGIGDLVAQFEAADDDPPHLARSTGVELLANPRVLEQPIRRTGKLLDKPHRKVRCDQAQALVHTPEVGRHPAGPSDPHGRGGDRN